MLSRIQSGNHYLTAVGTAARVWVPSVASMSNSHAPENDSAANSIVRCGIHLLLPETWQSPGCHQHQALRLSACTSREEPSLGGKKQFHAKARRKTQRRKLQSKTASAYIFSYQQCPSVARIDILYENVYLSIYRTSIGERHGRKAS